MGTWDNRIKDVMAVVTEGAVLSCQTCQKFSKCDFRKNYILKHDVVIGSTYSSCSASVKAVISDTVLYRPLTVSQLLPIVCFI